MFQAILAFQGLAGTLYDQNEQNPQAIKFFSSRSRSLRMLGTVRANVEMMWTDSTANPTPGQVLQSSRGPYYLVVKVEQDENVLAPAKTLAALNVLEFSTQITGYASVPATSQNLNVYSEAPAGVTKTSKTIRVIFDLTTSIFSESSAGPLPQGDLTLLTASGSGVAINDEYDWNGSHWRVDQVDPVEAAGQQYGLQVLMKKTMAQRKQIA